MARTLKFKIYRYDPDKDAKPYMQDLTVELKDTDKMLLDALQRIKSDVDDSLALRRSCREGVCGSDAMNINGKNGLACTTNLNELSEPIVLRPLPGLPVIRDLIVDMTQFFKQYDSIKPFLINDSIPPEKERLQSPAEREELDGDVLPVVLVESGQVRRPRRPLASLPLHRRLARRSHRRPPGQPGRPVSPVPLPLDHELRGRVPERPEPEQGDRQDQGTDGASRHLI
ncbi:hypothetical protein GCM10011572_03170 [Pseudoduganella buxea]|uniref:Succinate dehydrogenase iron-sulfur subunit n=1 Tax=Pseudoduganella buxea TaxID=1949069 RepID=A0ABQ1K167_9BURK|nr:hypothetical protein GCM10011572_03170 [Pseudoduganella buxea]